MSEFTIWDRRVARDVQDGVLEVPCLEEIEEWVFDSVCEAACEGGCIVEHDGHCHHGRPSWLIALGLI